MNQSLSLELLRFQDLVGYLVGDVTEVFDELDVLVIREVGFTAPFRCESGAHDPRLSDRVHAFLRLRPDPAEEVRRLVHADPGDFPAADLGQGLGYEDSEQRFRVILPLSLALGETSM